MGLTQISENGVKTDAITNTKLGDDCVGASELVDSSNSSNRAVTQNHIRDEAVDEARLQVSNAGTNGQFLSKQSGDTGGLTWATVPVPDSDKIEEGNTSIETVDTGSDGHVKITTEGSERVRVDETGRVGIGTASFNDAAEYLLVKNDGTAANVSIVASNDAHSSLNLGDEDDFNIQKIKSDHTNNSLQFFTNDVIALTLDNSQNTTCAGTVSDSKGDLRDIPANAQTGAYTLVAADAGKVVRNTTGGWTIPANTFTTQGMTVTLLNSSGSDQSITASGLTYLYNTADGANIKASTIALAARSMATIWFDTSDKGYIQASNMTVS